MIVQIGITPLIGNNDPSPGQNKRFLAHLPANPPPLSHATGEDTRIVAPLRAIWTKRHAVSTPIWYCPPGMAVWPASGFNATSSVKRAFLRVTGVAPSDWQAMPLSDEAPS